MKYILIADSGSTKTDWLGMEAGGSEILRFSTAGMNPFFQSSSDMEATLYRVRERWNSEFGTVRGPEAVFFYGAGCTSEKKSQVRNVILKIWPSSHVEVESDLMGAARALCGKTEGIACILGTGSNSCLYDGREIVSNISPLGFILGDEGSGAVLGKLWVADVLKHQQPENLCRNFLEHYDLTLADVIEKVYRQPFPNRFLASFSPFLREHLSEPTVRRLVTGAFEAFFRRNVMQYEQYMYCPVHFTGSVAYYFREILVETAASLGISTGEILRSPLEGLIVYHTV